MRDSLKKGVYIVAEMSCNHHGSLAIAHQIIDAAASAGADAVKIQVDYPDEITINSSKEDFVLRDGPWSGVSLYDLYLKTYTPHEWIPELKEHCQRKQLDFFASVSGIRSLKVAIAHDLPIIKISSFEARDIPLIQACMKTGKPIIVSCGCDWYDAWELLQGYEAYFLYCVSSYPAYADSFDLNKCAEFDGISDHSILPAMALAAVTNGARLVEKHLTLSRDIPTPDAHFSIERKEFELLVRSIRAIELARFEKPDNCDMQYCKSIYAVENIAEGEAFTPKNVRRIRPGYGLHPRYYEELLTKRANRAIEAGDRIAKGDV